MADNESINEIKDKSLDEGITQTPVHSLNAVSAHDGQKSNMFVWKIMAIVIIALIALVYTTVDIDVQITNEAIPQVKVERVFDERLLSCNKVISGEPTSDFEVCLAAAKDGQILAMKRIIWGYSRSNEFQNWSEVFNWLKAIPNKDENTLLLMYSIVHFMASSEDLKKDSERGIANLVAKNYPPANVILASIYALNDNVLSPTSNPRWLLERESNAQFNAIAPHQLALVYANGFVGDFDVEKASEYLKQVSQQNYPVNTNNIAWFLSTLDNNPFTSKDYPLSLAKQVTDDPEHGQNPIYIDTLAAALAANEQFSEAKKAQLRAIDLLEKSDYAEQIKNARLTEFTSRLSIYEKGEALVEQTINVDLNAFFTALKTRTVDYLFQDFFVTITAPPVLQDAANLEQATKSDNIVE